MRAGGSLRRGPRLVTMRVTHNDLSERISSMSETIAVSRHRARVFVVTTLACGLVGATQADDVDSTIGVATSVSPSGQAHGKPPSWAGKAFRQGVVAVANPYGAE